jgi:hypothetical protein
MPGETIWGIPWLLVSAVALGLAILFLFVGPTGDPATLRGLVIRYGHSACWVCLALAALAMSKATPIPPALAQPLAAAGGIAYAAFLAATFLGS